MLHAMTETKLYWLVYWDGHKHHVGPHRAETRELAVRHGLEHEPGMTLKAVISDEMNLSVPQMLELADVLPLNQEVMLKAVFVQRAQCNAQRRSHLRIGDPGSH